jgi:DNA polymerase III subunit beta
MFVGVGLDDAADGGQRIGPLILASAFVADAIKATGKVRDAHKRVRLATSSSRATLTDWAGNTVEGALVDGTFPDYERVIPRGETEHGTATFAREPLMRAVAAVTAFARAAQTRRRVSQGLRFAFAGDAVTVSSAIDGDVAACRGSASVVVPVAATTMREPREIGFWGPQILDILGSLRGRDVRFDFFDGIGPNRFGGDQADRHALHVIMPVRV